MLSEGLGQVHASLGLSLLALCCNRRCLRHTEVWAQRRRPPCRCMYCLPLWRVGYKQRWAVRHEVTGVGSSMRCLTARCTARRSQAQRAPYEPCWACAVAGHARRLQAAERKAKGGAACACAGGARNAGAGWAGLGLAILGRQAIAAKGSLLRGHSASASAPRGAARAAARQRGGAHATSCITTSSGVSSAVPPSSSVCGLLGPTYSSSSCRACGKGRGEGCGMHGGGPTRVHMNGRQ